MSKLVKLTLRYTVNGVKRKGVCWLSDLDAMKQIITDLELVADNALIGTIEEGGKE